MWNNNVDPSGFDYYPNGFGPAGVYSTQEYAFDNTSQYEFSTTSSIAQSSAAQSEYEFSQSRRPKPAHLSVRAKKSSKRESTQSMTPSQGQYPDGACFSHSNTMSPTMEMEFFSPYPRNGPNFNQDFEVYDSSPADSMFDLAVPNSKSSHGQSTPDSPHITSDSETSGSSSENSTPARSHPLYNVGPADDGYYYCPFMTEGCGHEPKQLKCEYDKHIDSHLKPFRCRHKKCAELQFSSTACLLRHERETHEMHGHEESLCEYPPCNRSIPGNGFPRSYNCRDHMTRCHGWVDHNQQDGKKRRSAATAATGGAKVSKSKSSKVPSKKQQIARLNDEWIKRKANLEDLARSLAPDGPLFSIALTQINNEMQTLKSIQTEWAKLTGRTHMG